MNKRTTFESKVFDNTKYADLTFLDGINSQMTEDPDKLAEHFSLLVRWHGLPTTMVSSISLSLSLAFELAPLVKYYPILLPKA